MTEAKENSINKQIIFCNCKSERVNSDLLQIVERHLEKKRSSVIKITDLCGIAATEKGRIEDLFKEEAEFLVIGCFPRTMKLIFKQQNSYVSTSERIQYLNLFEDTPELIIEQIDSFCPDADEKTATINIESSSDWPSWYPVIDYERCTACGQCADFCLFGVYDKSEDGVRVVNPKGCKFNCPACARICPATAIIFPKYKNGGAIGGSDSIDEQQEQKRQNMDIENLLGNDIYAALLRRKLKRQSIIREEAMKRAIEERDNALKKK